MLLVLEDSEHYSIVVASTTHLHLHMHTHTHTCTIALFSSPSVSSPYTHHICTHTHTQHTPTHPHPPLLTQSLRPEVTRFHSAVDKAMSNRDQYINKFCSCLDRDILELGKEVKEIKNLAQVTPTACPHFQAPHFQYTFNMMETRDTGE